MEIHFANIMRTYYAEQGTHFGPVVHATAVVWASDLAWLEMGDVT